MALLSRLEELKNLAYLYKLEALDISFNNLNYLPAALPPSLLFLCTMGNPFKDMVCSRFSPDTLLAPFKRHLLLHSRDTCSCISLLHNPHHAESSTAPSHLLLPNSLPPTLDLPLIRALYLGLDAHISTAYADTRGMEPTVCISASPSNAQWSSSPTTSSRQVLVEILSP